METKDRPSKTITRLIHRPSLELGSEIFALDQIKEARISFRIEEFSESRSASVLLTVPCKSRWDYHAEAKLFEEKGVILTGICTEAKRDEEGNLRLTLTGPFWKLNRTYLESFETFGFSNKEDLYWLTRLASPTQNPTIEGLELNTSARPFLYAIPLQGLTEFDKGLLLVGDTGITSKKNDSIFNQILEGAKAIEEEPWNRDCPRIFGVVVAEDFFQAERLAFERANLMVGIVNLALTTGMSHFETRYESEPLTFNAENSLKPVSLHPWIIISEVNERKGWIRHTSPAKVEPENTNDNSLKRIEFFLGKFFEASRSGDIHEQLGKKQLSDRELKLYTRTKRALHWLDIASREEDIRNQFAATWTSLESILNSIKYPGVFDGDRFEIKKEIRENIGRVNLPTVTSNLLSISTDMLLNRTLQDQWPLIKKLQIFAEAFGIPIGLSDSELVGKMGRARSNVFHEGENNPDVTVEQVNQLKYLVERLVTGTSVGGYEDLEDHPHRFQVGEIGPEGGGAPLSIDGKDVPYEFRMFRDTTGQPIVEWMAEGKIYTETSIQFEKRSNDQ